MVGLETLSCGDAPIPRSILFARDTGPTDVLVRFQCWLLSAGDRTILIDAGIPAGDPRLAGCVSARSTAELTEIHAASVTDVVLTHLHWDHVGDVEIFGNATIHVQARELELVTSRWIERNAFRYLYPARDKLEWILNNPKLNAITSGARIAAGIETEWIGGHTPGSQMVLVDSGTTKIAFTGDAVNRLHNIDEDVPPGLLWSLPEALDGLDRVRDLRAAGYTIAASHEALELQPDG
jgi:glyoxylase-like metal-dependent hydrolase (beta-lactamase superfamily II)